LEKDLIGVDRIFKILIYAPLPILIERDEKRIRGARSYVLSTFARFYSLEKTDEKTKKASLINSKKIDTGWPEILW